MTQLELPFEAAPTPTIVRFRKPEDVEWEHYEDGPEHWLFHLPVENVTLSVLEADEADPRWGHKGVKGWELTASLYVIDHHENVLIGRFSRAKQARDYAWRRFMQRVI